MKISLRIKIIVAVVSLVVLGGLFTAFLVYSNSSSALKYLIGSSLSNTASQTTDKLDRFMYEREVDVQELSQRSLVEQYLTSDSARTAANLQILSKQLDSFKVLAGNWSDLSIFDLNSDALITTDQPELIKDLTLQPQFKQGFEKAVHGQVAYSDVIKEEATNSVIMVFFAPVRNAQASGEPLVGVLVGELAWPSALELLNGLDSRAELLNSSGLSLGSNDATGQDKILLQDRSHSPVFLESRNKNQISGVLPGLVDSQHQYLTSTSKEDGYLDYKGNGWTLVLQAPKSIAYAPAVHLAKTLLFIFFSILILSIIVFVVVLEKLVIRPISNLKEVVSRLSHGDFSLRTTINSHDELGDLSQGFNDMADRVQFAYVNLKESTEIAQNERNILQTLLNNLPVGVFVAKAPSGEPIMVNRVGIELLGRGVDPKIKSSSYAEVYQTVKEDGSPYPNDELPLNITLREGRASQKDDLIIRRPDGERVALRVWAAPIKNIDGSFHTAVAVFEDISKERNLERSREEFFSIASHELRTPLTAIRGNSDLIQQYFGDKLDDPDLKEMVSDIHESANRLIEIVNDFLDTSRLEQKRMRFEYQPVNLMALAESVIKEFRVTSSRQQIHLEIKPPVGPLPLVWADSNRAKQVFINLIGNALKFTDSGTVNVSFQATPHTVKALVTDTGHGMTPEAQKILFKKFEQTSSSILTRDSVRGTGLGLYISKLIVEQMSGHIKLESSVVGVGTTFSFSLPIATDVQLTASKPTPTPGHPHTTGPMFGDKSPSA